MRANRWWLDLPVHVATYRFTLAVRDDSVAPSVSLCPCRHRRPETGTHSSADGWPHLHLCVHYHRIRLHSTGRGHWPSLTLKLMKLKGQRTALETHVIRCVACLPVQREFAVWRWLRCRVSQKTFDRTSSELSNGVRFIQVRR